MVDGYFADSYWASDYFASGYWGSGTAAAVPVTVPIGGAIGRRQKIKLEDSRKHRLKQLLDVLTDYHTRKNMLRRQTS